MTLSYSETDDRLYIGRFHHARGFGGTAGSLVAYTMRDGAIEQSVEYLALSFSPGMGESIVNDK